MEDKKLNEIEIDSLIKDVYTKIAEWHNDDSSTSGLKFLSIEIIQTVMNKAFEHFGLETATEVKLDKEAKTEALKNKYGTN